MGCFGHFSAKPTLLFGDWDFLRLLKRRLTKETREKLSSEGVTVKYINKTGVKRCHGGSRLKETQEYTRQFGKCVAQLKKRYTKKFHLKPNARRPDARRVWQVAARYVEVVLGTLHTRTCSAHTHMRTHTQAHTHTHAHTQRW